VLAYSTVSQLGFMFLALGVGAYGVAIFHVVTHAFQSITREYAEAPAMISAGLCSCARRSAAS
jgi:NADH:ubiquinone oxidoreductase subunit 2 (subunit N)